jgi:hypothetical protein
MLGSPATPGKSQEGLSHHRDLAGHGAPDVELGQQSHGRGLSRGRDCVGAEERLYSAR